MVTRGLYSLIVTWGIADTDFEGVNVALLYVRHLKQIVVATASVQSLCVVTHTDFGSS
jgi:hypothetical protein